MAARANKQKTKSAPAKSSRMGLFEGPKEIAGPRLLLIFCVFALVVIGLVMVYSSSSIQAIDEGQPAAAELWKQLGFALFGVICCVVIARVVPLHMWRGPLLSYCWGACVILLLLTALIGTVGLGAQRWLSLGPVSFQPSEFAKTAIILMMARIVCETSETNGVLRDATVKIVAFVIAPLVLIFFAQSDLGTTLICLVGILAVLWIWNLDLKTFLLICALIAAFGVAAIIGSGYRSDRISFLNPEADYYGSGYQLVRSFYAFGEGGLFGVGLGNSTEKYLYLPEAETDFIFAIIAEELGLVGGIAVVALFIGILFAGMRIARYANTEFGMMVAGSITVMLVFQAFLNIGCVIGALPTTGKPLPFISSGGSSLIASFVMLGFILSVSFSTEKNEGVYDRRRQNLRLVRTQEPPGSPRNQTSTNSRQRQAQRRMEQRNNGRRR